MIFLSGKVRGDGNSVQAPRKGDKNLRRIAQGARKADGVRRHAAPVRHQDPGLVARHDGPQGFGAVQEEEEVQTTEGVQKGQEGKIVRRGRFFCVLRIKCVSI